MRITKHVVAAGFLMFAVLCAAAQDQVQQQVSRSAPERRDRKADVPPAPLTPKAKRELAARQQLGRQLLEAGEAEARGLEAPLRAYALWQVALGYQKTDKAKAITALADAFTSTLGMEEDEKRLDPKPVLQRNILTALLPLSLSRFEELMPQAVPKVHDQMRGKLLDVYVSRKNFERAIAVLSEVQPDGDFPYRAATQLLRQIPADHAGDRERVFTQAIANFEQHKSSGNFNTDDLGDMVARDWQALQPDMVMQAVDTLLDHAQEWGKKSDAEISVGSANGSAVFNSLYEYRLFQLLPAIRGLDPGRAEKLLKENAQARALAQRYPEGIGSLDPNFGSDDNGKGGGLSTMVNTHDRGQQRGEQGPGEGAQAQYRAQVHKIIADAEKAPKQAVAQALALPEKVGRENPRAEALNGIFDEVFRKEPSTAKQALDELLKTASSSSNPVRQSYLLSTAASNYLKINEKDGAEHAIQLGMKLAEKLYAKDKDAEDPNKALKGYWPSATTWRNFIFIAARISPESALQAIQDVPDPEIKVLQRIAYANALLGAPQGPSVYMSDHKNGANMMMMSNDNGDE